jgi:hypothetical protein
MHSDRVAARDQSSVRGQLCRWQRTARWEVRCAIRYFSKQHRPGQCGKRDLNERFRVFIASYDGDMNYPGYYVQPRDYNPVCLVTDRQTFWIWIDLWMLHNLRWVMTNSRLHFTYKILDLWITMNRVFILARDMNISRYPMNIRLWIDLQILAVYDKLTSTLHLWIQRGSMLHNPWFLFVCRIAELSFVFQVSQKILLLKPLSE